MSETQAEKNFSAVPSSVQLSSSELAKPWGSWLFFATVLVLLFAASIGAWIAVE